MYYPVFEDIGDVYNGCDGYSRKWGMHGLDLDGSRSSLAIVTDLAWLAGIMAGRAGRYDVLVELCNTVHQLKHSFITPYCTTNIIYWVHVNILMCALSKDSDLLTIFKNMVDS